MIFSEAIIQEGVEVPGTNIVHPKVRLGFQGENSKCTIGEQNIIEELTSVMNSSVGSGNLIEVGCVVEKVRVYSTYALTRTQAQTHKRRYCCGGGLSAAVCSSSMEGSVVVLVVVLLDLRLTSVSLLVCLSACLYDDDDD
jgi:hypothetical protein